jgi:hypothetical protein
MKRKSKPEAATSLVIYFVPCSCGTNIAVREGEQSGPHGRQLHCPSCGKKHDRHYRAIRFEYEPTRYWKSEGC